MQHNSITILTNTTVKAIVTDKLKESTHKAFVVKLKELEQQREQLKLQKQFYTKKLESDINQLSAVIAKLDKVESDLNTQIAEYNNRIQQIFKWEDGQEILQTQVQSLVDVKVGDIFTRAVSKEIVLKDGVVVEIRNTGGFKFE